MQHYLTAQNGLIAAGALLAVAHAVQAIAPPSSKAYWLAGKAMALGTNLFDLVGYHPNPPSTEIHLSK